MNIRDNVILASPKSYGERAQVGSSCVRDLGIEFPALVDDFENTAERAYTGWPDRLYVIGRDGTIAHKSGAGPFGFNPRLMEQALRAELGM